MDIKPSHPHPHLHPLHQHNTNNSTNNIINYTSKMSLDFSLFHSDQSQSFCNDLLDTLKKRGVARLTNHGIPDEVIFQLFDMVYPT